jgi:hypothetical protein
MSNAIATTSMTVLLARTGDGSRDQHLAILAEPLGR